MKLVSNKIIKKIELIFQFFYDDGVVINEKPPQENQVFSFNKSLPTFNENNCQKICDYFDFLLEQDKFLYLKDYYKVIKWGDNINFKYELRRIK